MTIHIIPDGAKVVLEDVREVGGFDGHSLRAAYYSAEYMPEITYKLSKVNHTGKFYKVTVDGKTEYYHESDLPEDIKGSIGI